MNCSSIGKTLMLVWALGTAWSENLSTASEALTIGSDKQLFVGPWAADGRDKHLVESMENVTMTMNEAHVTGERLLVVDKPWEGCNLDRPFLDMRQFVFKDGDLFRMYYSALPKFPAIWKEPHCRILCYAESIDGIRWKKPNLGLCTWEGSKDNNIIFPYDGCGVIFAECEGAAPFVDPNAKNEDEKYKMFAKVKPPPKSFYKKGDFIPRGQYAFVSPDAIHWKMKSTKTVNRGASDTQFSVFWDERIAKYVAYTRMKPKSRAQEEYYFKKYGIRGRANVTQVGRTTADDFLSWEKETSVIAPDQIDWANAPKGQTRMTFYGGNVSKYSEAPNVYIAIPNAYYHWKYDVTRTWGEGIGYAKGEGLSKKKYVRLPCALDVQLVTSRDGVRWNRTPKRRPFIRLGPKGTFWSSQIYPGAEIIRVGDELWIYFAGLDASHNEQYLLPTNGARGRAVLRLDGFISADAAYTGGELTTKPIVFSGDKLQLNVDTSAGGVVKVEILDEAGKPVKGFTEDDGDEINGNYIRVLASWKGSTDVSALAGRAVRLRFVMRDTKLYSFQFLP